MKAIRATAYLPTIFLAVIGAAPSALLASGAEEDAYSAPTSPTKAAGRAEVSRKRSRQRKEERTEERGFNLVEGGAGNGGDGSDGSDDVDQSILHRTTYATRRLKGSSQGCDPLSSFDCWLDTMTRSKYGSKRKGRSGIFEDERLLDEWRRWRRRQSNLVEMRDKRRRERKEEKKAELFGLGDDEDGEGSNTSNKGLPPEGRPDVSDLDPTAELDTGRGQGGIVGLGEDGLGQGGGQSAYSSPGVISVQDDGDNDEEEEEEEEDEQAKLKCEKRKGYQRTLDPNNGECVYRKWCNPARPWRCKVASACSTTHPCGDGNDGGGAQVCSLGGDGAAAKDICYPPTQFVDAEHVLTTTGFCGRCKTAEDVLIGGQSGGAEVLPCEYVCKFLDERDKNLTEEILLLGSSTAGGGDVISGQSEGEAPQDKIREEFTNFLGFVTAMCDVEALNVEAWQTFQDIKAYCDPNYIFTASGKGGGARSGRGGVGVAAGSVVGNGGGDVHRGMQGEGAAGADTLPWGLDRIDQHGPDGAPLDSTYKYTYDGAGVDIYVLDSWIELDSPEFTGRIPDCRDFRYDATGAPCVPINTTTCHDDVTDAKGEHGMSVAAIAAGSTYGVARGANVVPVPLLSCETGTTSLSKLVNALDWVLGRHNAADSGSVVNLSMDAPAVIPSLDETITNLHDAGVLVVVAAGNGNGDACQVSPAFCRDAITVGATTKETGDPRQSQSNFGTCLDMFAPGQSIPSAGFTTADGDNTRSGTSQASPHVAGVAAQILSEGRDRSPAPLYYTPDEVLGRLQSLALPGVVTDPGVGSPNLLLQTLPLAAEEEEEELASATVVAKPCSDYKNRRTCPRDYCKWKRRGRKRKTCVVRRKKKKVS